MIQRPNTIDISGEEFEKLLKLLWANGRKIDCIRLVRTHYNAGNFGGSVGLKEAKDYCKAGFQNVPQLSDCRYDINGNALVCLHYDSVTRTVFYRKDDWGRLSNNIASLSEWLALAKDPN